MLGPLDHVYYWVTDMDRAVAFYQDVVGLRLLANVMAHMATSELPSLP